MGQKAAINEAETVVLVTDPVQSGLTDVEMIVTDSAGASGAAIPLVEDGSTGQYRADFTPVVLGAHVVQVTSASSDPAIGRQFKLYDVEQYSSSDIKAAVDSNMGAAGRVL